MYPIPEHRKQIYEYYRLTFDATGCPMKQMDDKLVFHPILPPYLVVDYVAAYKKTQDIKYLEYAEQIADKAYSRGSDLDGARVFYYLPESGLSSVKRCFYSALTQASIPL